VFLAAAAAFLVFRGVSGRPAAVPAPVRAEAA
jgi:hypothetical protein